MVRKIRKLFHFILLLLNIPKFKRHNKLYQETNVYWDSALTAAFFGDDIKCIFELEKITKFRDLNLQENILQFRSYARTTSEIEAKESIQKIMDQISDSKYLSFHDCQYLYEYLHAVIYETVIWDSYAGPAPPIPEEYNLSRVSKRLKRAFGLKFNNKE